MYSFELADIYDATYHFKDYAADAAHLRRRIAERRPGASSLLEVATGTGRYLELLRPGFAHVEGLDLSGGMVAKAASRLPGVPLHVADMTKFELGRRFDVVCCLFRSIGYCRTVERMHAAVRCMADHLEPGGLLVVEPYFTPQNYWVDRVTLNEYRGDDLKVSWMYVSKRPSDTLSRLDIHFLVGTPAGVTHFVEEHLFGLYSADDYAAAFAAAGLSIEFDADSPGGTGLWLGTKPPA